MPTNIFALNRLSSRECMVVDTLPSPLPHTHNSIHCCRRNGVCRRTYGTEEQGTSWQRPKNKTIIKARKRIYLSADEDKGRRQHTSLSARNHSHTHIYTNNYNNTYISSFVLVCVCVRVRVCVLSIYVNKQQHICRQ